MDGYRPDLREPLLGNERKRDWLMLIPTFVLMGVVYHFSTRGKAVAAAAAFLTLYVVTSQTWDYRRERWFWLTVSVFAVVHATAIVLLPMRLPSGPAMTYVFPLVMADGFLMWGLLRWLGNRQSQRSPSD